MELPADTPADELVIDEAGASTAVSLDKHLAGTGVLLLHDRRIPGDGGANIDHLAVGPGGVTVIDSKTQRGKIQVDRVGGRRRESDRRRSLRPRPSWI